MWHTWCISNRIFKREYRMYKYKATLEYVYTITYTLTRILLLFLNFIVLQYQNRDSFMIIFPPLLYSLTNIPDRYTNTEQPRLDKVFVENTASFHGRKRRKYYDEWWLPLKTWIACSPLFTHSFLFLCMSLTMFALHSQTQTRECWAYCTVQPT